MAKKKKKFKTTPTQQKEVVDENTVEEKRLTPDEIKANRTAELRKRFGNELYDRATKSENKIGMTDDQLDTYTDPFALKMVCDNIRPVTTPQTSDVRKPRPPQMRKVGTPAILNVVSVITAVRAVHVQRSSYDEMQMRDELMRQRIRPESIQSVELDRNYIPDASGDLETKMVVHYLK